MTDTTTLRQRIAIAAHSIARDSGTSADGTDQILVGVEQLLDAVERIVDHEVDQAVGTPIEELHLPARSDNLVRRQGIRTIEQLTACSVDDLYATPAIGAAVVAQIRTALAARGLALATDSAAAAPAPEFFQPGKTYIQAKPYIPPESLTVFRCWSVAAFPGNGDRAGDAVAFGFATVAHPGDRWSIYICGRAIWAEGWNEYVEDASEAGR